jgi:hypothetical protein
MGPLVSAVLIGSLVLAPLVWRRWLDRQEERALALRACIGQGLRLRFGGEPLLAVEVHAPMPWRVGRVVLRAPRDMERLLAAAWSTVASRVPEGYEIVVPAPCRAARPLRQHTAAA